MNCTHGVQHFSVRSLALLLSASLFAGCSVAKLLPTTAPLPGAGAADTVAATPSLKEPSGKRITVRVQIRIPRRRRDDARTLHPATISPMTRSIGIIVNGGGQHVFNATPASPNCSAGASGTLCTFSVDATVGTDTFVVTTYSGTSGSGTPLNRGAATVPIAKGKANAIAVRLGPVVTTTADNGVGSLRYAIGSANAGDTIMFLLPTGSTLAPATPIVITGNVTIAGPGTAGTVTLSGGNAHQIFVVIGKATISGLTLTQGRAAVANNPGGAIFNTGTLTLVNDKIGASTSTVALEGIGRKHVNPNVRRRPHCTATFANGGAVYNNGTLTMSGNTFNGNVIQSDVAGCVDGEGGAVFNDVEGTIASTGDTFTNNSALAGGAVYNMGIGLASFTNDAFTGNSGCNAASGCPTSGCTTTGCTSFAQGEGAAIFDIGGIGVTIASSTFTNNVVGGATAGSQGQGGALALLVGAPTITGSVFTGNLAGGGTASCSDGEGGAIAANTPLIINNDAFTGNRAGGDTSSTGGAIFNAATLQGSGDSFKSNAVVASGSACDATASAIGGAVYALMQTTLTNSTFQGNAASGNGEGAGGAVACNDCFITGDTFTSNLAAGTGAANATSVSGAGGALFAATLAKVSGSTFTSNAATIAGPNSQTAFGGAVVVSSGSFVSSHNAFTSNAVREPTGTGIAVGGGLAIITGNLVSNADTFASNSVTGSNTAAGGGAYVASGFTISGATFSGNHVAGIQGVGGGAALTSLGLLTNSTFVTNSASGTGGSGGGGAIYDAAGVVISDCTLSQNAANSNGGGILTSGSENVIGTTITGNKVTAASLAVEGGGGIFSQAGIEVENSTISNNTVTVSGGGSSGGGGIYNGGGITLAESTISGNAVLGSAPSSGGGGFYDASTASLTNVTISGNSTSLDGGGIDIAVNTGVILANVTLYKNAATGTGGNINNPFSMILSNSIVAGGTAATAPDIKNGGTITSGDYNIIQTAVVGNPLSSATGNDQMTDPKLLPLSNNGGATFTNADQPGGPGTAYIPFSGTTCGNITNPIDQRGYTRGAGTKCDVGAFEYGGVPTAARHHSSLRRPAPGPHVDLHLRPLHVRPIHLPAVTPL
jgi:hypothetical protein